MHRYCTVARLVISHTQAAKPCEKAESNLLHSYLPRNRQMEQGRFREITKLDGNNEKFREISFREYFLTTLGEGLSHI